MAWSATIRSPGSPPSAPAAPPISSRGADSVERLRELLAWAATTEIEVGVVGSGSNLLVADDGFRDWS